MPWQRWIAASSPAVAGGPLLDLTSPRAVFLIAGAGILAVTAYLWFALRDAASPDHPTRPG